MRRRLLLALLPLLTLLLGALEVPLAQTYAARLTQGLFIKRIGDAQRFAAGAEPILRDRSASRQPLRFELARNKALYDIAVKIVDVNGHTVMTTGARGAAVHGALHTALLGLDTQPPPTAWPWRTGPMIVGTPVGRTGDPIGAVVVQAPTSRVRAHVARRLLVLAAAGLGVLVLICALCALPLVRWIVRPIDDLGDAATRLAGGDLAARACEHGGPPELRLLAGAFNHMAESLVAALERQRAFVADASHELRNPLGALRLRLDALSGTVGPDGERDLRLALAESDRLAATLNRLLELARAEATSAELVDFDVAAVAIERGDAWRPAIEAAGGTLVVHTPANVVAHGPADAVAYALDVLLDNAHKFAPGSTVDVTVRERHSHAEITVRDRGSGLGRQELERAGERFWRSARHRQIDGTGLGLATSRALLQAGGCSLRVDDAAPGLAVRLTLPTATATPPHRSSPAPQDADPADRSRSPSSSAAAQPPGARS